MQQTVSTQSRPWDRPWWKPLPGKGGVFAFIVLSHSLALLGLILFPIPSLKILGSDCGADHAGRAWIDGCVSPDAVASHPQDESGD